MKLIGIRREDKNKWEQRVPLVPEDVQQLVNSHEISTLIQPSTIRTFTDEQFKNAGATVQEDVSDANLVLAVKEIPINFIQKNQSYVFFSHTIKGQHYNMPLLKALMDNECNLLDYEKIADVKGRRLIFFGKYAGVAGMIETLYAYGQKLAANGIEHPFQQIKQAFDYSSIEEARSAFENISTSLDGCEPVFIGLSGYGNVSQGAQEILDIFNCQEMSADELISGSVPATRPVVKIVFKEEDMVEALDGNFDLQTYFKSPELYKGKFSKYIDFLDILVNCIYWTEDYPRLVTKDALKKSDAKVKLQVIGDISCDIEGSIEITKNSTYPDDATYSYFPDTDEFKNGTLADGITVMAIDNLPCEFPKESSKAFSEVLKDFVPEILMANFEDEFDYLELSYPLKNALILHRGRLTENYKYLEEFLNEFGQEG